MADTQTTNPAPPTTPPAPAATAPAAPLAPPVSPELVALKNQQAILEQELLQAQTRQKLLSTMAPSTDVKPLEGTIKLDGDHPVESQILAYSSLNRVAKRIADCIAALNPKPGKILIHSEADAAALLGFQAFVQQMTLMAGDLQRVANEADSAIVDAKEAALKLAAAPLVLLGVGAAVRAAVDLLSLFRVDVSLKYKDLTIGDAALVAAVSGNLVEAGIAVYYPSIVPPLLFDTQSGVLDQLKKLDELYDALDQKQKELEGLQKKFTEEVTEISTRITSELTSDPAKDVAPLKRALAEKRRVLDHVTVHKDRVTATATAFTAFKGALLKPDDSSGMNAFSRVLRAEKLARAAGDDSHLLMLKVAAAGGGYKTKQSRVWSAKVLYSGGAIVEYILFAASGEIKAAATVPVYSGFIEVKERDEQHEDLGEFR